MDISYNYIYTLSACNQIDKFKNIIKNEKLEIIYRDLFRLLNNCNHDNNLLIKLWIEYLHNKIENFLNVLRECDNFIESKNNEEGKNNQEGKNNEEIKTLYLFSHSEKKFLEYFNN